MSTLGWALKAFKRILSGTVKLAQSIRMDLNKKSKPELKTITASKGTS